MPTETTYGSQATCRERNKHTVLLVGTFLSSKPGSRGVGEELALRLPELGWSVLMTSDKRGRVLRLVDMMLTAWHQRKNYDVAQVDVYSGSAFVWAEAVCWTLRKAGRPYVLALRGGNLPTFARRWPGRVRLLFDSAAAITVPSRYLYEAMHPYHSDLRLLPNPLDLKAYEFRLREKPQPRVIWLRSFHKVYNPALAPRVIAALAKELPEIHLTMVGPDKGDGSLQATQQVARNLGVANHIDFPGPVSKAEVPRWLNKGDIYLNTTNVDNTPVTLIEAMACGLCVVSTNVGGVPYLVEHDKVALLVPPDDVEAMAAAIRRFLITPAYAATLSRNAREQAERFDWSMVLPQWGMMLTDIVQGKLKNG